MFFKNAINKKIVCITLCRPPPFLGCSAAEIRRVYSNLPYINLVVLVLLFVVSSIQLEVSPHFDKST